MRSFGFGLSVRVYVALAVVVLACSCGRNNTYKEKTATQIAEEYHKNLVTDDLSLFELKGNVRSVTYPHGFLSQYSLERVGHADSIFFSASGLCESALTSGGDSLQLLRNTVGAVGAFARPDGRIRLSVMRNEDGHMLSWQMGDTLYTFVYTDGHLDSVAVNVKGKPAVSVAVDVIATDNVGNWTKRKFLVRGQRPIVQFRQIVYY